MGHTIVGLQPVLSPPSQTLIKTLTHSGSMILAYGLIIVLGIVNPQGIVKVARDIPAVGDNISLR